jgi:nucleotide-binding universal stress UspA family protein
MFKRCLICTDFTDGLQKLVYFVSSIAKGGLKEIIFLHSVPIWEKGDVPRVDQDKINEVKESLSPALKNLPPGVKVSIEVPSGEPLDTIPEIAKNHNIDLTIVATPLRSAWEDRIFGHTTIGLTKSLNGPMMIFRPQLISVYTEEELDLRFQHLTRSLLIPYNDGTSAHYLLEQIKYYASQRPENSFSKCVLIWVVEDISRAEELAKYHQQEAQNKLNEVKADLEKLGLEVEVEVRTGKRLTEIVQVAFEYDISAIAIAANQDKGLLEWTVPSFTQELLHRCWFPLLFFTRKN